MPTVLSWRPCDYATSYDVILWPFGDPKPAVPTASGLESPFYEPIALHYDTDYLWQVVARNIMGTYISADWTFTTGLDPFACVGDDDEDGDVNGSDLSRFNV